MKRRAFTLLEVILALALAAVVLGLLAMAVEIHLRVADKSRFRVEEAQLARTLLERIAEDLRNAIPCSQSSSSGGCLLGNARELQVDISHLPRTERPVGLTVGDSPPLAARLSDARTVTYGLASQSLDGLPIGPTGEGDASANTYGGLIRRELERAAFTFAGQQGLGDELEQATELLAPEVTDLQFSYYDGSTTYEEWDSTTQGRLPAAVRVAISIRPAPNRSKTLLGLTEDRLPAVYEITIPLANAKAVEQETSAGSTGSDASGKQSDTAPNSEPSDDKEKKTDSDRQTIDNSGKKSGDNGKGRSSGNRGKRSGRGGGRSSGGGPGPAPGEKPPGPGRPPGFGPPPGPAPGPVAPGPVAPGPAPRGAAPPGPRSPAPGPGPRSITPRGK